MGGGWVFSGQRNIGVFWAGWGLVGGVGAVGCGVKVRLSAGGSVPLVWGGVVGGPVHGGKTMAFCKKSKAKKALKSAQKAAAKTAKAYAKEQKKAAKKGGKGLLFLGLLVAGAVAGAAAFKASRPVEDPWKTPAA